MNNFDSIMYPCYIHKKLDGRKIIYLEDTLIDEQIGEELEFSISNKFESIYKLRGYALKGEIKGDKLYLYDGMTTLEWKSKSCDLIYEDRLGLVRHCVNVIADYKNIIDTPLDICDNLGDILNYTKQYREEGYSGAVIKEVNSKYEF